MKKIDLSEYNYNLPVERIAEFPLPDRSSSQLLVYKNQSISTSNFKNLPEYLPTNSLLCMNETKVIHARFFFNNSTGAKIEILCLEPFQPSDYVQNLSGHQSVIWKTFVGNKKKWKEEILQISLNNFDFTAEKLNEEEDNVIVKFSWNNPELSFGEILDKIGHIPLPPYIKRKNIPEDAKSYQTVFAKNKGSVAAPTAGLHITNEIINDLSRKNIEVAKLTLHVGAGTFKPIKDSDIEKHHMHSEYFRIDKYSISQLIQALEEKRTIVSLGTTVARTLESLFWIGLNPGHYLEQWTPYQGAPSMSVIDSLNNICTYLDLKDLSFLEGHTSLLITPQYKFKIIDALITNFHQPKSTLLLLVAALVGNDWKKIYDYALSNNYRFLSYGDGSLLFREQ